MFVGIDVSKDRLDVHLRPSGEAFAVSRDGAGIAVLVDRLRPLAPALVALEATGGFEITVAAGIAGAGLPLAVINPAQIRLRPPPGARQDRPARCRADRPLRRGGASRATAAGERGGARTC